MEMRWSVRALMAQYGRWLGLLAAPLLVNAFVWAVVVRPHQRQLAAWRRTTTIAALKPQLEALLVEGHRMAMDWTRTGFSSDDPTAVTQAIQRLGERHHVRINALSVEGAHEDAGGSTVAVGLEALGNFGKLSRWMSEVEAQSGLQIESWTLTPETAPDRPHRLAVSLTAFLNS